MNLTWLRRARSTLVAALLATFVAGILFPVYTDEIGWRFQERAAIDGVDKMFSEVCGMNTLAVPPFFMWPVRYYSAFFNLAFDDPFYIRVSGILYAAVWLAMLLALLRRVTDGERPRLNVSMIAVALMSMGTLPFLLVMSRPEQPLGLVALGVMLVSSAAWRRDADPAGGARSDSPATAWRRGTLIVVLAIVAMSYHLKSLFLLPLILACLFFCARGAKTLLPRLTAMAGVIVLFAISTKYWVDRVTCLGNEQLHHLYAMQNIGAGIGPLRTLSDYGDLVMQLLGNVKLLTYALLIAPTPKPMSHWVEWYRLTAEHSVMWYLAMLFAFGIALVAGVTAFGLAAMRCWKERRFDPRLVCAVAMTGSMLAWSATQVSVNAYEASFVLPQIMLSIVLSIAAFWRGSDKPAFLLEALAAALGLGALASLAMTWTMYGPTFVSAAHERGYLSRQPFSVSVFGYQAMEPRILATAKMCHIPPPEKAHAVMVDDYTSFAYVRSYLPQHQLGVLGLWAGSVAKDPLAYLRSRKSDGVIVQCSILSGKLRARAKANGQFCCIAPSDF